MSDGASAPGKHEGLSARAFAANAKTGLPPSMVEIAVSANHRERGKAMAEEYKQLTLKERKEIEEGLTGAVLLPPPVIPEPGAAGVFLPPLGA